MNQNPNRSWWSGLSWSARLFILIVAFVILALLLASPTYWHWINGS